MGGNDLEPLLIGFFHLGAVGASYWALRNDSSWPRALGLTQRPCEADAMGKGLSKRKA